MNRLKWTRVPLDGWTKRWTAADGLVVIDYYQNAVGSPWKVVDNRYLPQPIDQCWGFFRTLAEAKAQAEAWTRADAP